MGPYELQAILADHRWMTTSVLPALMEVLDAYHDIESADRAELIHLDRTMDELVRVVGYQRPS